MQHILRRARRIEARNRQHIATVCRELVINPQSTESLERLVRILNASGFLKDSLVALKQMTIIGGQTPGVLEASVFTFEILGKPEKAEQSEALLLQKLEKTPRASSSMLQIARFHLLRGAEESAWLLAHRAAVLDGLTDKAIDRIPADTRNFRVCVVCGDDFARIIHHSRWFRPFAKRFEAHFAVDQRLIGVLSRNFPDLRFSVNPDDDEVIKVDFKSVPFLAGSPPDPTKHWFRSDPERTKRWRMWLEEHAPKQFLVGINWRSTLRGTYDFAPNPRHALADLKRNLKSSVIDYPHLWRKQVPLGAFRRLFADRKFQAISVQHGLGSVEANYLKNKKTPLIIPEIDFFGDLEEVVSLIDALDGLISIPSTHAHIAAALGKPVIILEHERPSQYWGMMRHRRHYAAVASVSKPIERLEGNQFRFGVFGDWGPTVDTAFEMIRRHLAKAKTA